MYIGDVRDVRKEKVTVGDTVHTYIQWLITKDQGAENYAMRFFTIKPKGKISRHSHPWEHEIYMLHGTCKIGAGEEEVIAKEGNFLYIEPDVPHWYENVGDDDVQFICIIPMKGSK